MWAKARASGLEMTSVGRCNQYNRERWLERVLKEVPPGSRILDAGAGEQQYKRFCTHLRYVAQDFGQYNGKGDGKGLQTGRWNQEGLDIVADIASIPEPDGSFQAVMCVEVFEHIPEPIKALREFRRLLVTGGYLIITAPFCSLTHFAPYHFYTGFNRYFYEKHLPELGFEILELVPNGNYFEQLLCMKRNAIFSLVILTTIPRLLRDRFFVISALALASYFTRVAQAFVWGARRLVSY